MYWLPKLHKRPYNARFIANSSSCTTTELSKLLTSCLTAIKAKVIKYCETVYERDSICNEIVPINQKVLYLYALRLHSQKDLLIGYTTAKLQLSSSFPTWHNLLSR